MKQIYYSEKNVKNIINIFINDSQDHIHINMHDDWKFYITNLIANPVTFRDGILITEISINVMIDLNGGTSYEDAINKLTSIDNLNGYHINAVEEVINIYSKYSNNFEKDKISL